MRPYCIVHYRILSQVNTDEDVRAIHKQSIQHVLMAAGRDTML